MSEIVVIGDKTIAERNEELDIQANAIVKKYMAIAAGVRVIPMPLFDQVVIGGICMSTKPWNARLKFCMCQTLV